jgi:hypothetical protein
LIVDGVFGFFHWLDVSGRIITLASTQSYTEMRTKDVSWGKGSRWVWLTTLSPLSVDCIEILETLTSWIPKGLPKPVEGLLALWKLLFRDEGINIKFWIVQQVWLGAKLQGCRVRWIKCDSNMGDGEGVYASWKLRV